MLLVAGRTRIGTNVDGSWRKKGFSLSPLSKYPCLAVIHCAQKRGSTKKGEGGGLSLARETLDHHSQDFLSSSSARFSSFQPSMPVCSTGDSYIIRGGGRATFVLTYLCYFLGIPSPPFPLFYQYTFRSCFPICEPDLCASEDFFPSDPKKNGNPPPPPGQ